MGLSASAALVITSTRGISSNRHGAVDGAALRCSWWSYGLRSVPAQHSSGWGLHIVFAVYLRQIAMTNAATAVGAGISSNSYTLHYTEYIRISIYVRSSTI